MGKHKWNAPSQTAVDFVETEALEEHHQQMLQAAKDRKKQKAKERSKAKTSDISTQPKEDTKKTSGYGIDQEEVYRIFPFQKQYINILTLASDMKAYADREADHEKGIKAGWTIRGFCLEKGFILENFQDLCKKHTKLGEAYAYMKGALGERRDYGAATRHYDGTHVRFTLGHYDPIFVEERRKIIQEQAEANAKAKILTQDEPIEITIKTIGGLGGKD